MTLLLDSVIVIDYLNRVASAQEYVDARYDSAAISVITMAEVLVGTDEDGLRPTLRFLDAFHFLSLRQRAAVRAAHLRRDYGWKLPDAFQAALALENGLELVTRNTKDFNPDEHTFVTVPYRL